MAKAKNFGDLPKIYCRPDDSKIVIVPVPYDRTSTWIKGADKGPEAIIEASANMELYDIETDSEVYRHGIFTDKPIKSNMPVELMVKAVHRRVLTHIEKGKFTVILGGEHSVSIGAIEAHVKQYADITVLQLDAHADLRDEYEGSKYNHACVMARVKELCPIVQVGIRSMDSSEKQMLDKKRVFFAERIVNSETWVEKVVKKLTTNVYITIDLDVFDPSIMPSTGTPEPGGLSWYDVLKLLKEVSTARNVIGFDVVELCPNTKNKSPDFLAAKLIYKLLSYKFRGKNEEEGLSQTAD
jgi:agmatinase